MLDRASVYQVVDGGPIAFLQPVELVIKQLKASRQRGDITNRGEQLNFLFFFSWSKLKRKHFPLSLLPPPFSSFSSRG